jgi:ATP-dependent protease HslVU (ClpYQ) ATPase subunit
MNQNLLEEIKRMHEIIGIKPNIISENSESVEESGIPGTSQFAKYLAKILVSDVITIGAKSYTKAEVRVILNKVGLRSLSTNEIAVVKEATSRAIAKDASKSVLNTIAKTFVNDLKAITDDAVAEAQYQEFKATFNTILKDTP